jgi:hypothetical protein
MPKKHKRKPLPTLPILNDSWIVPPPNPPGFGILRPELRYKTPLVTGQVLFDDAFHTVFPPPPLGPFDPTYPQYLATLRAAEARINACPPGRENSECAAAREAYYEASRQYAYALDALYGLRRFQNGNNRSNRKNQKNRT